MIPPMITTMEAMTSPTTSPILTPSVSIVCLLSDECNISILLSLYLIDLYPEFNCTTYLR